MIVFLFAQSKSLFEQNDFSFDGYLIDTTFRIMQYYKTSIITICFSNSSLPIGFSFGVQENKRIYKILLDAIEEQYSMSFENQVIENDQHRTIFGICEK